MQTVELRKCNIEDIPALRQVALQSYQEHYMYLWLNDEYAWWYMNLSFSEESLKKQINEPDSTCYFIINNSEIVGFLKMNVNKPFDNTPPNKSIELERLYLLKKATNKGIGRKVVQIIIDEAKKNKLKAVWLKSMESSKAVHFYESIGFKIIRTEVLPFEGFKDEYRNIHVMTLDLNY